MLPAAARPGAARDLLPGAVRDLLPGAARDLVLEDDCLLQGEVRDCSRWERDPDTRKLGG